MQYIFYKIITQPEKGKKMFNPVEIIENRIEAIKITTDSKISLNKVLKEAGVDYTTFWRWKSEPNMATLKTFARIDEVLQTYEGDKKQQ